MINENEPRPFGYAPISTIDAADDLRKESRLAGLDAPMTGGVQHDAAVIARVESVRAGGEGGELQQEVSPAILGAVARGWCADANTHKIMDIDLAIAIAREVQALPAAPVPPIDRDSVAKPASSASAGRDAAQLANLLLISPENGLPLSFAGPLESWGMGLNQAKLMDADGNVWTMVAGLREGYKTEAQRNANLLRVVDEELAATQQPAAPIGRDSLTRWHHNEVSQEMHTDPIGEYYLVADVADLLAATPQPAAPGDAAPLAVPVADQQGDLTLSDLLREYAGNGGYSHGDYADVMLMAATEIERLAAPLPPSAEASEQPSFMRPTKWTLLLTGDNHGLVGKFGHKFEGSPGSYELVDVVSIGSLAAPAAPLLLPVGPSDQPSSQGPIDANELEQMATEHADECFLKGSGVLKLISAIRTLEQRAAATAPALTAKGYVLARETVVAMPDGKNELGYTLLSGVGVFNTRAEVSEVIAELSLPLGWVSMTTAQLLLGWMLPHTPSATPSSQPGAPLCTRCAGEGGIHTGIDESPTTQCNECDGTGFAAAASTGEGGE